MLIVLFLLGVIVLGVVLMAFTNHKEGGFGCIVLSLVLLGIACIGAIVNGACAIGEIANMRAVSEVTYQLYSQTVIETKDAVVGDPNSGDALVDLPNMKHSTINAERIKEWRDKIERYNNTLYSLRAYKKSHLLSWLCWYSVPDDLQPLKM